MSFYASTKVLAAAAAVAMATTSALAQDLPQVRLQAVAGSLGGVPLMIMQAEGLDEKYGFDGVFDLLPSDSAAQNFLIGNSDISMDNDIIGVSIARAEGFDVTAFYPIGNLYLGIVVPGNSDVQTPEDLIGMKVGHFGADSGTTMFIRSIVEDMYGFDVLEEYNFSQVGPAALVPLLEAGDVDAIFNFESYVSEAMLATQGRYILQAGSDYAQFTGGFAPWISNMVAHTSWLKENPELAYAVRDAYDEALQIMAEGGYEILREDYIAEGLGITSPDVLFVLIQNARTYNYFTNDWTPEILERAYEFLEGLAEEGVVLTEVPEGVMVRLEDLVGERGA